MNRTKIILNANIPDKNHSNGNDLVCYCFEYTKKIIEDDFKANGCSTIPEKIKKEKSINGCNCEVKNPKGK